MVARSWSAVVVCSIAALLSCGDGRQRLRLAGGQLTVDPPLLDLGPVALGRVISRTVTLRNDGVSPLSVEVPAQLLPAGVATALGVEGADFTVTGLPLKLRAGDSMQVQVQFSPAREGERDVEVPLHTNSALSPEGALQLAGQGVLGLAQLTQDVLDFGAVVVGQRGEQSFALVNNERADTEVRVEGISGPDAALFTVDVSGPAVLRPEDQLVVHVTFAPTQVAPAQALLQIVPCPTCAPRLVKLIGEGALRAVEVQPAQIDFGDVAAGTTASQGIALVNVSRAPVDVTIAGPAAPIGLVLDGGRAMPVTLGAGERLGAQVTFSPTQLGAQSGKLTFQVSAGAPPELAWKGNAFGPLLTATPPAISNLAAVPGTSRTVAVTLSNTGLDPKGLVPLAIAGFRITGADAQAWSVQAPALPWTIGPPGSSGQIQITWAPKVAGTSSATLVIDSNDSVHPGLQVPLGGVARDLPPCQADVEPALVDFGNVGLGRPVTSGFEITNVGAADCILGDPQIVSGGPQFHWPGTTPPAGRTLPPGGRTSVRVQFTPDAAIDYAGEVQLYVSNAQAPTLSAKLRGHGDAGCFTLSPATLDFGAIYEGCSVPELQATAHNGCSAPVSVTALSASAPFVLPSAAPFTLGAGQSASIAVDYRPATPGDDVGELSITASTSATPYTVGLTGASFPGKLITDAWSQSTPKVDLLFVIDNSGSMGEEQDALARNLDKLWARIALANADFHIAVTTTGMYPYTAGWTQCPGGASGGEAGRFFPVDGTRPRLLTPQTPNVRDVLFANMNVGQCHWDERFTEPVMAAISPPLSTSTAPDGDAGFLRDDARLALLAVSDTDDSADELTPPTVSALVDALRTAKHGALDLVSFSGIVALHLCPTAEGLATRYQQISQALNGHLEDICNLDNMGAMLDRSLDNLLMPLTSFPLSATPRDPSKIVVTVNGQIVAGWSYDPTSNRIVFPTGSVPPPGSEIAATYEAACQ